ncbi:MAG: hypothetical protein LIO75_09255 [Lachnospiraceae bacterium]|nr:hypothetical protein [Lachnospiraceae bacterium]
MKKERVIRISFIVCAVLAIGAFRIGYYFGNTDPNGAATADEDMSDLYIESDADASETMADTAKASRQLTIDDSTESVGEETDEAGESEKNTEVICSETSEDTYCLRKNGSYLSVYRSDSDDVYFDTGMRLSDLPEDVQAAAETGIFFESLEELYGFLENYSS